MNAAGTTTDVRTDDDINADVEMDVAANENENEKSAELPPAERVADILAKLRSLPQPDQRTPEWYAFRQNLITASSAWKALGTQASVNQLICEKCTPLSAAAPTTTASIDTSEQTAAATSARTVDMATTPRTPSTTTNTSSPMHWGQKYEPVSALLYEDLYASRIGDFGCIPHPTYPFLGASPDGIVLASDTGRYGRMLEIKNIVNREITGIPKPEYWIQMQIQMEVCDLDECDFLETKFVEYEDAASYCCAAANANANANTDNERSSGGGETPTVAVDGDGDCSARVVQRGVIMHLHNSCTGAPYYAYMPLRLSPEQADAWKTATFDAYTSPPYEYTFVKYTYWKLEKLSCVLVARDRVWFQTNIARLAGVWDTITKERVTGHTHRLPKKRPKREPVAPPSHRFSSDQCFLNITKIP